MESKRAEGIVGKAIQKLGIYTKNLFGGRNDGVSLSEWLRSFCSCMVPTSQGWKTGPTHLALSSDGESGNFVQAYIPLDVGILGAICNGRKLV